MTELDIYFWTRLDGFKFLLQFLSAFGAVASIILIAARCVAEFCGDELSDETPDKLRKTTKFIWVPIIIMVLLVLTPSSKDFAMIKVIPSMVNSEMSKQIQEDIPEIYQIAVNALKEKLSDKN